MSAAELRLRYSPENEWNGELFAAVRSGAFSGEGSAWFGREQLQQNLVVPLRAFPLSASNPPMIEGGYWGEDKPRTLTQCHLRIAVRPFDSRGALLVQVDLASSSQTTPDKDLQQLVTVRFLTEYTALDTFAADVEQVLDGKSESAVLRGRSE
jgi:hypothetical protein